MFPKNFWFSNSIFTNFPSKNLKSALIFMFCVSWVLYKNLLKIKVFKLQASQVSFKEPQRQEGFQTTHKPSFTQRTLDVFGH